jgi:hypothetical protein
MNEEWKKNDGATDRYSINENRLFYAWNWFSFHAGQRTTVFNFFLVAVGLILTAFAKFVEVKCLLLADATAILGFAISIIFLGLDFRNRTLTNMGEDVLRRLEAEFLFEGQSLKKDYSGESNDDAKAGFLNREGRDKENFCDIFKRLKHPIDNLSSISKHRFLIPLTHSLFAFVFIVAFLYSFSLYFIEGSKSSECTEISKERTKVSQQSHNSSKFRYRSLRHQRNIQQHGNSPAAIAVQEIPCTHKENEIVEINKFSERDVNSGHVIEEPNKCKGEVILKDESNAP